MAERKFRVIICEDEPRLLANLKKKIEKLFADFEVVATAEDGDTALAILDGTLADVLVTDIRMPGPNGLELIKLVASRHPNMKAVVISGYGEFDYAQQAIRHGVVDYLLKPITDDQLDDTFAKVRAQLKKTDAGLDERSSRFAQERPNSTRALASMVRDYILENYMRDINVQTVSDRFHVNSSYLSRVFSKHVGEGPSKYIMSIRIEMAKAFLVNNPTWLIRDVGELVGYQDQFYFSRVFKHCVGMSPEAFRAIHSGRG
jgi:two-component system response regulator YesN